MRCIACRSDTKYDVHRITLKSVIGVLLLNVDLFWLFQAGGADRSRCGGDRGPAAPVGEPESDPGFGGSTVGNARLLRGPRARHNKWVPPQIPSLAPSQLPANPLNTSKWRASGHSILRYIAQVAAACLQTSPSHPFSSLIQNNGELRSAFLH